MQRCAARFKPCPSISPSPPTIALSSYSAVFPNPRDPVQSCHRLLGNPTRRSLFAISTVLGSRPFKSKVTYSDKTWMTILQTVKPGIRKSGQAPCVSQIKASSLSDMPASIPVRTRQEARSALPAPTMSCSMLSPMQRIRSAEVLEIRDWACWYIAGWGLPNQRTGPPSASYACAMLPAPGAVPPPATSLCRSGFVQ